MADQTQELLKIKAHIEKAKTEVAKLEGQVEQLCRQRSSEFGCATDAEANAYIKELEADVARLEKEIEEGVQAIQEELGW
jgi:hypothetical protein